MTYEELKYRQSWTLHQKIDHAVGAIEAFLAKTDGRGYISFSGGKDSTVLLDIARRFVRKDFPTLFCNTGNEFPDIVYFVRSFENVTIIRPKMRVKDVIEKYGFPLVSKEQSHSIRQAKTTKSEKLRNARLYGSDPARGLTAGKIAERWKFLINAPFMVSEMCCYKLKKEPFELYHKETGLVPIIGTMADESRMRQRKYLNTGCNNFDSAIPTSSPLSIFTERDIWEYKRVFKIPFAPIYSKGCRRTGCMFCGFGCHLETGMFNRFDILHHLHPKAYAAFLRYENNGITYREALEYIGIELPDGKIKQQNLFGIEAMLQG